MIKPSDIEQREEAARLLKAAVDAQNALDAASADMPDEEFAKLDAANDAANQAYNDYPLIVMEDLYGNARRCALTNVPLLESDETEMVLRSALGLPPREKEDSEEEAA